MSKRMTELDRKIEEYCKDNKIFGMLRITHRDCVLFEKNIGFADLEKRTPFSPRSMFTFYSLSKPFCAIGLLKLKDRGLIDLDRHPSVYVPEAAKFDARVTVRQMLHHTSGLPDFEQIKEFAQKYAPGYPRYARTHTALLAEYPQFFVPGTAALYANINMVLCSLIVENVTGLSYAEYMEKEVFAPLGMKNAVIDDETRVIADRVQGYALSADGTVIETSKSHDWLLGAGDIVGTVDDVYALNRAIKHGLLLSPDTWQEVLTPSPLNSMGMGCTVSTWHGKKRITHNGGHLGFRTLHIQLPEDDFDVIFLSNSGYGDARNALSEMIHSAFYGDENGDDGAFPVEMDKGYI